MTVHIEPLPRWQAEVVHPRNTDYGRLPILASHPSLRRWRIYDQVRRGTLSKSEMVELLTIPPIAGGATVITPTWTQAPTAPIAIQTLALGAIASGTVSLIGKWGGYAYLFAGKQAVTAQATGLSWFVRRKHNSVVGVPTGPTFVGDTVAATSVPTMAASGNTAANTTWVTVTTGFAVGDSIFIDDTGNVGLANSEWDVVTKVASTVTHTTSKAGGLEFSHNSVAAHASNHADVFTFEFGPNGFYEIVAANLAATGSTDVVRCLIETFDSVAGT